MNTSAVDPIVKAVLYEGHILYPYRPSAIKNRRRFTFGRVYPRLYSRIQNGREPWKVVTQCLLQVDTTDEIPMLEVGVRFLQPLHRQVLDQEGRPVERLTVEGKLHQSWHDVVERSVETAPMGVVNGSGTACSISYSALDDREEIQADESVAGYVEQRRSAVEGTVDVAVEEIADGIYRVSATVSNESVLSEREARDEDEVLLRTFASTHTILQARGARFVSMTDPPEAFAGFAAQCENTGTWPVLVGDAQRQDTLLSSPIILYDYPEIAPESAGDLFDSTEIDELLSLRIMTLTDDEKDEMRSVDAFARRILERTERMDGEDLFGMHGTLRGGLKEMTEVQPPEHVEVHGRRLTVGDRVRINPNKMADVLDVALAGKAAEIESIEQDFEGKIHLALVIEDDPGKDLGMMRQPGHRFFYGLDEIEPMGENEPMGGIEPLGGEEA